MWLGIKIWFIYGTNCHLGLQDGGEIWYGWYGLVIVASTKRQEAELELSELKMIRFRWERPGGTGFKFEQFGENVREAHPS